MMNNTRRAVCQPWRCRPTGSAPAAGQSCMLLDTTKVTGPVVLRQLTRLAVAGVLDTRLF